MTGPPYRGGMWWSRTPSRQAGQATVEHIGVVVVVALLMAAVSLWAAGNMRPSAAPPPIASTVVGHLQNEAPGSPAYRFPAAGSSLEFVHGGGDEPIGRFLKGIGRLTRDVVVIGGPALARGFVERTKQRAVDMVRDPLGTIRDTITGLANGNPNILAVIRDRVGEIGDYVVSLRGMTREEMIRTVAQDLGAAGADFVIDRGRGYIVREGISTVRGRRSRPADSRPPAPAP